MEIFKILNYFLVLLSFKVPAQFPPSSHINPVSQFNVSQILSEQGTLMTGHVVNKAGDFNGDGIDDLLIGSNGNNNNKGAYVVFGEVDFSDVSLNKLDGINGFAIVSPEVGDAIGFSIKSAGDFNSDGYDDVIVGAFQSGASGKDSGRAYLIFGSNQAFSSSINLSELNGINGFVINGGVAGDQLGFDVSTAGDFNSDGYDDVMVSAYTASNNKSESGSVFIIYGTDNIYAKGLAVDSIVDHLGFRLDGASEEDHFGGSVSFAGDVNGDGIDDVVIGAILSDLNGDRSGATYVIFGRTENNKKIDVSNLFQEDGIVITGSGPLQRIGYTVLDAGDFNHDGIDDLLIGSPSAFSEGRRGAVYVVFGQMQFSQSIYNIDFSDGLDGVVIRGTLNESTLFGFAFASGFDLNADGFNDYAFGAPFLDSEQMNGNGAVFVLYGGVNLYSQQVIDIENINGQNGFIVLGSSDGDELGYGLSSSGDLNNDGTDDLAIGARGFSDINSGTVYILHDNDAVFMNGFENQ